MPTKYKSLMALKKARKVHNVQLYNDNTGYGSTGCGIRVLPSDVTTTGIVNCRACKSHMDGSWLKKMAKLEEGCDVAAGGSLS